jgi:hypothetical protein
MVGYEGDCDYKDSNDDGEWEPGILCEHPHTQGDDDDGGVGRDGNKYCAHGLRFNLEFHLKLGM